MKLRHFLFIFLFFSFSIFAERNQNITFSIQPDIGFSLSTYDEKFYSDMGKQKEVSYLKWETKPLYSLGFETNLKIYNFDINTGFDYALPVTCGNMYDSDYDSFSDLQYCYSISELKSKICIHSNIDFAYNLAFTQSLSFLPKISLYYYYDFFEARNGYGWYGMETNKHPLVSWDDSRARYYEKGTLNGVDFYRHSVFSFFGFELNYKKNKFCIGGEFQVSPYAYFYTMDHHLSKSGGYHFKQIQDSSFNYLFISLHCSYSFRKNLVPVLDISHISGDITKGKLYSDVEDSELVLISQKSGGGFKSTAIKIGMIFPVY